MKQTRAKVAGVSKLQRAKVKLHKRQKPHGYREPEYPFKYVEERF